MPISEKMHSADFFAILKQEREMAKRSTNGRLEDAMLLLINNQANFVAQLGRGDERFSRIEAELAEIKLILLRHEQMLQSLPEAVRQKIGFER